MELRKRPASPPEVSPKQPRLSPDVCEEGESVESSFPSTCTTSSQGPVDASRASDHKYRYLSAFESWVSGATFYPVPNATNVKVTVELEGVNDLQVGDSSCKGCFEKAAMSGMLDAVASVNWAEINSFDVQKIDERLYSLATSAQGALKFGFGNGQAKVFMFETVSLVRKMLCARHTLRLNLSTPLTAGDHAGLIVRVYIKKTFEPPSDDSSMEELPSLKPPTSTAPSACDSPGTADPEDLKGAPDLTVILAEKPHVFLVVGELKKKMTRMAKIKLKGWRPKDRVMMGHVERRNSQIGQLLYYLLLVQLRRIQLYLSPSERPNTHGAPHDLLGVFMEQGKTTHVVASATVTAPGVWKVQLRVGEEGEFSGGELRRTMKRLHTYLSMDV